MKNEFVPKALCILKSGGPVMVVTAFYPGDLQTEHGDTVETMWFNAQGDLRREVFATKFLTIVKEQEIQESLERNRHE